MTPHTVCPGCGQNIGVRASMAGQEVRCPLCKRTFIAPATAAPSVASPLDNPFLRPKPRAPEKQAAKLDGKIILAIALLIMTVCLPIFLFVVLHVTGGSPTVEPGAVAHGSDPAPGGGDVMAPGSVVSKSSDTTQPGAGEAVGASVSSTNPEIAVSQAAAVPAGNGLGAAEALTSVANVPAPIPSPASPPASSLPPPAAPPASSATSQTDLVGLVEPSLVVIDIGKSMGSGFVYDELGAIVTNYHVIEGAKRATVRFSDKSTAEVTGYLVIAPGKDLAVLRIDPNGRKLKPLPVAAERPKKAESVFAFGAPRGLESTVSNGIVSAVRQGTELRDNFKAMAGADIYSASMHYDLDAFWIQTTAPISGGNSGGPLVNLRGEVVGLNTWHRTDGQNLNFAISIEHAKKIMESTQSGVQPLSSLPKSRHDSPSHGASDKTLAYWNEIGKINRALFERLKHTPRPHVPPKAKRSSAFFAKLAVYYKKVADFLPETTHKLRALDIAGVDGDLVLLATADALQLETAANGLRKLSIEAEIGTFVHIFDMDQIYKKSYGRFDFADIGAAYELMRLKLSARYQEQFPNIASDAGRPKPKAKSRPEDPEQAAEEADAAREKDAASKLKLAKQLLAAGKREAAREWLEKLLEEYAGTKAAEEAEAALGKLDDE